MTQLQKLKIRLGLTLQDTSQDDLLNLLLEDAQEEILAYCNRTVLLDSMLGLQRNLAQVYYNRLNTEGLASRSEGAISESYSTTTIPENLLSQLNSFRLLKIVGFANASS